MKKEAKEYLKNSSGILIFAIIIIGVVIFSNLTNFPSEELNFIIILLAVVIIWQVFSQALRYESKELQQNLHMNTACKIIHVLPMTHHDPMCI